MCSVVLQLVFAHPDLTAANADASHQSLVGQVFGQSAPSH